MTDETYKKILDAIDNCDWKKDVGGIPVCRGEQLPCSRIIDSGKCQTIIERIMKEEGND